MSDVNYQGPGRYRHYKGCEYEVLGLALKEDTVDKSVDDLFSGTTFVIYRQLTGVSFIHNRQEDFWARELSDFDETVDVQEFEGHFKIPRFKKIS